MADLKNDSQFEQEMLWGGVRAIDSQATAKY